MIIAERESFVNGKIGVLLNIEASLKYTDPEAIKIYEIYRFTTCIPQKRGKL